METILTGTEIIFRTETEYTGIKTKSSQELGIDDLVEFAIEMEALEPLKHLDHYEVKFLKTSHLSKKNTLYIEIKINIFVYESLKMNELKNFLENIISKIPDHLIVQTSFILKSISIFSKLMNLQVKKKAA